VGVAMTPPSEHVSMIGSPLKNNRYQYQVQPGRKHRGEETKVLRSPGNTGPDPPKPED